MDQVKKIMKVLLAQRFWIIVAIVTLVPLGGWYTTTAAMRTTTENRKKLIDSKFKEAQTVSQKTDHPNDTSHAGMEKKGERLKQEIKAAWEFRYSEQEKLLVWPDPLGDEFKRSVERLNPIERVKFPTPPADEISIRLRERYRDYIQKDLPKLAAIIDAKWVALDAASGSDSSSPFGGNNSFSGPGGGFPGTGGGFPGTPGSGDGSSVQGAVAVDTSKVIWNESDQMLLRRRYDWQSRPDHAPKTLDVLYAQEDLWLMTALMNIFAETNQGATARYNAVIKEIKYISVGAAVGGSVGSVMRVTTSAGGSDSGLGMPGGGLGMPGGGMPYSPGGAGGSLGSGGSAPPSAGGTTDTAATGSATGTAGMAASASPDPANNRYVNNAYTPVSADTLRKAIESDAQNENEAYLLVAKRIPIRIGLTIDQRKLHRFITACGNSKLMVEVRQVRFNRVGAPNAGGGGFGGSGGMGGAMGGGMGGLGGPMGGSGLGGAGFGGRAGDEGGASMPGMGGMGGSSFGGMSGNEGSTGALPKDMTAHDKPVEIYGIVYIYNPVDVKKLKYVEAAQPAVPATPANKDAGSPPAANPTTPAANPATPATNPATPATNPATNPATPAANPATPAANPATPAAADTTNPAAASNPAAPASNPSGPPTNPATPAGSGPAGTNSTAPAPNQ